MTLLYWRVSLPIPRSDLRKRETSLLAISTISKLSQSGISSSKTRSNSFLRVAVCLEQPLPSRDGMLRSRFFDPIVKGEGRLIKNLCRRKEDQLLAAWYLTQ